MVPLPLIGERDGAAQHVGRKMDVRIGEDKPFALRLFETGDQRVREMFDRALATMDIPGSIKAQTPMRSAAASW